MNFPPKSLRRSAIGIDVGSQTIKAAQLVRRRGAPMRVESAVIVPRARSGTELDLGEVLRLGEVLDRRGFHGHSAVLTVGFESLQSSVLELPTAGSGAPVDQIARMELARIHQREPGNFEFAQWEIAAPARASKATHAMSVACDHPVAEALLDPFEAGGFEVCAIDAPLAAAARACANAFPRTGGMCALLDLGWQSARIAVLHDQVIVYTRSLQEAGLSKLVDSLIENLGVSREAAQQMLIDGRPSLGETRSSAAFEARSVALEHFEAMVRELSVSFSYAAHQYPAAEMQKLLVLGGGEIGELESYFEERLRFAVGIARPKELMDCAAESVCQSPAVVTAIGLAMHEESWA